VAGVRPVCAIIRLALLFGSPEPAIGGRLRLRVNMCRVTGRRVRLQLQSNNSTMRVIRFGAHVRRAESGKTMQRRGVRSEDENQWQGVQ